MLLALINIIDSIATSTPVDTVVKTVAKSDTVKSLNNITFNFSKIEEGNGILITIVGMGVVFAALAALSIFFIYLTKAMKINLKKKRVEAGEIKSETKETDSSGEIDAAICMALHLHFSELHDYENTVLTINKVQRTYSPWSSKIYGLRNYPRK
ncbi:MAG TPA: OadG family protein [Melioribacteraceae bacterium]|nr:OadG family protein [Melioribacteraceae bacterium]